MKSQNKKKSFFDKLTGSVNFEEEQENTEDTSINEDKKDANDWIEEKNDELELAIDVYQTPTNIVLQTMVAGVKTEDLELAITRDTITIKGRREEDQNIDEENYFVKELYWGKFSRTINLPKEVEPEEVEATEKHGLLTIKIQKVDKEKRNYIKIKSI